MRAGRLGNGSNLPVVLQQPTIIDAIKARPALQVGGHAVVTDMRATLSSLVPPASGYFLLDYSGSSYFWFHLRRQVTCALWTSFALLEAELTEDVAVEVASVHTDSSEDITDSEAEDPDAVQLPKWTDHVMFFPPTVSGQVGPTLSLSADCDGLGSTSDSALL